MTKTMVALGFACVTSLACSDATSPGDRLDVRLDASTCTAFANREIEFVVNDTIKQSAVAPTGVTFFLPAGNYAVQAKANFNVGLPTFYTRTSASQSVAVAAGSVASVTIPCGGTFLP